MMTDKTVDMEMPTTDTGTPATSEISQFLSEYSTRLLSAGATCIRLDKNVSRIAEAFGKDVEMYVMPRHIHLHISDRESGESQTVISAVSDTGANFKINTELSRLSWEIADKRISFSEAYAKFKEIVAPERPSKWLVLILVTLANASFCRLFGGDFIAMATVWVATFAGFHLKQILMARKLDIRITFIICAFVSTVLAASDTIFALGSTPSIAMGTSVLYLVPGIPFLNSFSDVLYRHYICAFSRFADAVVLTACLSTGLCLGMWLMNIRMF